MPQPLTADAIFKVKESVFLDLLAATVFICMVVSTLSYNSGSNSFDKLLIFGLLPAITFLVRAFINRPSIIITKEGIYLSGHFVTDWNNFFAAKAQQLELATGDVSERVVLIVEFYKQPSGDLYKDTMPLSSTQNKSESEIIAAIEFFYDLYQKKQTAP